MDTLRWVDTAKKKQSYGSAAPEEALHSFAYIYTLLIDYDTI